MNGALRSASLGGKSSLRVSWPLLVFAAFFFYLTRQPALLNDPDLYWHLTVGQWIVENVAVPRVDHYSHTMLGAPWVAHEWLAEALFFLAYKAAGWTAVVWITAASLSIAMAVLVRFLLRYVEPVYALMGAALSFSLVAPHLLARPHTLVTPLLVAWGAALLLAHEERRAPTYWLAPLMALWANLHGSFVFGLALYAVFAVASVLVSDSQRRRATARGWAGLGVLCLLAAMSTPSGPGGLVFAFAVNDMAFALSQISEWRSPDFQQPQPLELALLLVAAGAFRKGLKLSWLELLLVLGLLHLALKHSRHADLLALIGPLVLARPVGAQWFSRQGSNPSRIDAWFLALARPADVMTTVIAVCAIAAVAAAAPSSRKLEPPAVNAPEAALEALAASHAGGPGLNAYDLGGYLIRRGVPTFIDGRADLYGDRFLFEYVRALNGEADLKQLLDRYRIKWTLLRPYTAAVQILDHLPEWKRIHADPYSVVHVREGPPS